MILPSRQVLYSKRIKLIAASCCLIQRFVDLRIKNAQDDKIMNKKPGNGDRLQLPSFNREMGSHIMLYLKNSLKQGNKTQLHILNNKEASTIAT